MSPLPRPGEGQGEGESGSELRQRMRIGNRFPDYGERRKELRRESTLPEVLLWRHLRSRTIDGVKFRRQHQLGPYIVDFYCATRVLAIELDGGQYFEPEAQKEQVQMLRASA